MNLQAFKNPFSVLLTNYSNLDEATFQEVELTDYASFIQPTFQTVFTNGLDFQPYIAFIEQTLEKLIPPEILNIIKKGTYSEAVRRAILTLNESLPCIRWSESQCAPYGICISFLVDTQFTQGVGRYLTDIYSRWLVPGKLLNICSSQSLRFKFRGHDFRDYFLHQVTLDVDDKDDLALITTNLDALNNTIGLNVRAVKYARHIVSQKKLSTEQKQLLIQEYITSVVDRPSKEFDLSLYDQMHHLLIRLSAEGKLSQIKDKFSSLIDQKPKFFDRDIFQEMQHFVLLFRDKFSALRDLCHISRLISYQYLFRKSLQGQVATAPNDRHLVIKLMKTKLQSADTPWRVLGILVGINVVRENELFGERHIFEALEHYLPGIQLVPDSYIVDRRTQDKIRLFYLEVAKKDGASFPLEEIKKLQQHLRQELKGRFENVIHPVLMPRNEEEFMRNIRILAQELRYVNDIPQVIISFEEQTQQELSFTVIFLRLLKGNQRPLKTIFSEVKADIASFADVEAKVVGHLRKRHAKEANLFRVKLNKKPFLRKDYSLDLFKARQTASKTLASILGEFRDFNGGIFSTENEVLRELRQLLIESGVDNDFLLENYFYSLTPPLMRSILPPRLLKEHFLMLLETTEENHKKSIYSLKKRLEGEYILIAIGSSHASYRQYVTSAVDKLLLPSSSLTSSFIEAREIGCQGYILRFSDEQQRANFESAVQESLRDWEKNLKIV